MYAGPDTPDGPAIAFRAGAPGGRDGPAGGVAWCAVRQAHGVLAGQGGQEGGWYDSGGPPFKTKMPTPISPPAILLAVPGHARSLAAGS